MSFLLAVILLLTPAYVIKFNLFNFPTDILMSAVILFWIIFAVWLTLKKHWQEFFTSLKTVDKKLFVLIILFFLAGIISLFFDGFSRAKLGQFIVLFLQPISIFFIGRCLITQLPRTKDLLLVTCYLLLGLAGTYAIIQYFSLIGLPPAWWGNSQEPKRALSFFIHPNFYALWSAPLLAFLIPDVFKEFSIFNFQFPKFWKSVLWLIGAFGLLLSLSRAGWVGLAAAILIYLIFAADKKTRKTIFAAVLVIVMVIVIVPNLRWRLILPFRGEKSTDSRIELWQSGWKAVKTSPIFGLGLTGYSNNYQIFQTDKSLDTHNFPHNIFLDLWVETGLLGLISFIGLISIYIYRGLKSAVIPEARSASDRLSGIQNHRTGSRLSDAFGGDDTKKIIRLSIALFLTTLLVQGQIDNPYFKNDLAMVFWIILALG